MSRPGRCQDNPQTDPRFQGATLSRLRRPDRSRANETMAGSKAGSKIPLILIGVINSSGLECCQSVQLELSSEVPKMLGLRRMVSSAAQGKIVDPATTLIFPHVTGSQRLCMSILYERRYRGGGLPAKAGQGTGTSRTRPRASPDLAQRRIGDRSCSGDHALTRRHDC
jgi:hypothetical protein